MSVRMWPVMPKDYADNGLGTIERQLNDEPDIEHYIIARVNRRRATVDDDSGETTPTMRVLHIEACAGVFEDAARQLLTDCAAKRTGGAQKLFEGNGDSLGASGAPDPDDD